MIKRIISAALALLLLVPALALTSCGKNAKAPKGTLTRITVDINPSIELMVDDSNKVISATALNDDGSILIAGEALVGMQAEEAAELIVSLAAETGYLVKGNVSASENEVKISVSGNTKYAKQLLEKTEDKISAFMKKHDIEGKVAKVEAAKAEALRKIALSTSLYTEKEINAMTEEQLYKVIAAGRVETALLLTAEMREAYYTAKEHKVAFAERESTANVIKALGGTNTLVYTAYKAALDTYGKAITAIDEFRYNTFISPESEYQKSLAELREKKTELLAQKNYVAKLEVNGEEYTVASASLKAKEENYNKALAAYEKLGKDANAALEKLVASLRGGETMLASVESKFGEDIKAELSAKAAEREAAVNAAKAEFFENFESAHKDDIAAMEDALEARKKALMDAVKAGK
ncbi:MAG: hypothetical protein IJW21_01980 [Clostridia bacterium]|nr:hypothetical protein [Clostridia bacterium]